MPKKIKTRKNITNFLQTDKKTFKTAQNEMLLFSKKKNHSIWYGKLNPKIEKDDLIYAAHLSKKVHVQLEVLGQELFRFYLSAHPKYRMFVDKSNKRKKYYVASKEVKIKERVPNIFDAKIKNNVLTGNYQGLGHLCVLAIFLNEYDFKYTNVVLLEDNNYIKLDGGWLFSDLQHPRKRARITSDTISKLPAQTEYTAYNWIGYSLFNDFDVNFGLDYSDFSNNAYVRSEINEALLKILVTPLETLNRIVCSDIHDPYLLFDINNLLQERQQMLLDAAVGNKNFCEYIKSARADEVVKQLIKDALIFSSVSKNTLYKSKSEITKFTEKVNSMYKALKKKVTSTNQHVATPAKKS